MNNIKISIIIPAYNIEKYIIRCLRSVAAQDYDNFEAVIINDGSTDDTERLINEFITDKPNFRMISQANGGLSCARNKGIDVSTGDYIMFLDGDDELAAGALGEMTHEIENNELDALYFDADFLREDGTVFPDPPENYNRPDLSDKVQTGEKLFVECMKKQEMLVCACFYVFRKELLDIKEIRFYPGIIHEDCLFTPRLMFACSRVKHVNRCYYRYYNNSNSIMTSKNDHKEAVNYGIVADELIKSIIIKKLSISTRRYFRDYCISMYSMGRLSYIKLNDPDKELQDRYKDLKIKTDKLQDENKPYSLMESYRNKLAAIGRMVSNG